MTEPFRILPPAVAVMAISSMATLAGCVAHLDDEHFGVDGIADPSVPLGSVLDDCSYPPTGDERDIADVVSLRFPDDGTYWLFAHALPLRGTSSAAMSSGAVVAGASAFSCSALEPVRDGSGNLQPVIPLNSEEVAFNDSDPDGRMVALYPTAAVWAEGRGYVYYRKVLLDPSEPPAGVGVGVAEITFGGVATRLEPQRYPGEPTLLWIYPQDFFGTAALWRAQGAVYVYGCHDFSCFVGSAYPDEIANAGAYQYDTSADWSDRLEQAEVALRASQLAPGLLPGFGDLYVTLEAPTPSVQGWQSFSPHGTYIRLGAPLFEAPSAGVGPIRIHPSPSDELAIIATYRDERMRFVTVTGFDE